MKHTIPLLLILVLAGCGQKTDPAYVAEIDAWHAERVERLKSDTGWLTLVGLHPLQQGVNDVGSGPEAEIELGPKAPALIGSLVVTHEAITFGAAPEREVFVFGEEATGPVTLVTLATDLKGPPTILASGSFLFHVIDRQGDLYLRVKDREAEALKSFTGIDRYPVEARWRVRARLEGEPGTIRVPNVLGQVSEAATPGTLVFEAAGRECRVVPQGEPGESMFLVFGDATNGSETYPGGRFLVIEAPEGNGDVWIDFNRAYNPPCVFSDYATCPLPTPENKLEIAVRAGEQTWGEGH